MRFSERIGIKKPKQLQKENLDDDLRNSIWNVFCIDLLNLHFCRDTYGSSGHPNLYKYIKKVWLDLFKLPIDELPTDSNTLKSVIKKIILKSEWHEVLDFLEFSLNYIDNKDFTNSINQILEKELSGYRYVGSAITELTDSQEIELVEAVLNDQSFPSVRTHFDEALKKLSARKNPDFRNSIKESISAVESITKIIAGKKKATLPDALKVLSKQHKIHQALIDGFSKLYGYTSDADGIRHSLMEESSLNIADARYFMISCMSFVNYLKTKI